MNLNSIKNEIEKNQIYAADCVDILKCLPSESIDLIIADPPYYRMRGEFDFVFQSVPEYLNWCMVWVGNVTGYSNRLAHFIVGEAVR